jgi:hypothetical protein
MKEDSGKIRKKRLGQLSEISAVWETFGRRDVCGM